MPLASIASILDPLQFGILSHLTNSIGTFWPYLIISTVASEAAFGGAGRVIDPYRALLSTNIVEVFDFCWRSGS
ncbi:unnamed protein product [Cuscuta campestris]|uniref:HAT C-terminal dimerisation domain-containing protein n=1 Tax=Cuscuta campestris TaxID=132261 RepID=A0A484KYL7_9ASTE|nr:unnamed protein product [Cuscuta campestris]